MVKQIGNYYNNETRFDITNNGYALYGRVGIYLILIARILHAYPTFILNINYRPNEKLLFSRMFINFY